MNQYRKLLFLVAVALFMCSLHVGISTNMNARELNNDAAMTASVSEVTEEDDLDFYLYKREIQEECEEAVEKIQEENEAEKVHSTEELYQVVDAISDSEDIETFGYDASISKKAMKALEQALKELEDGGYSVSFVLIDSEYGFGISKDARKAYYSASALKGPYVCAAVSQEPEKAKNYENTITQVLQISSNDGYETLRYAFGPEVIEKWYEDLELGELNKFEHYSDLSVCDMSKLWIKSWGYLESGTEDAEWIKSLFEGTLNSVMSDALDAEDDDTTVYSKAGWITDAYYGTVQNDAGVVVTEGNAPYYMVIFSSAYCQNEKLENVVAALDDIMKEMQNSKK